MTFPGSEIGGLRRKESIQGTGVASWQGLLLPGALTLLKTHPSAPPAMARPGQATTPSCLAGLHSIPSPPSLSHLTARETFLNGHSPEESRGCSSQGKIQVCHSQLSWYCLSHVACPHSSHLLSQPFLPRGLYCFLCLEACIYSQLCWAQAFLLGAPRGGLDSHVGFPITAPSLWFSPIWQFCEGGSPSGASPGSVW